MGMFDVLDELEVAVDKVFASERPLDVERVCRLAERVEFLRLRAVGEFDRSGAWEVDGFASPGAALRARCNLSHGAARGAVRLAARLCELPATAAAFAEGVISRQHAVVIAEAFTPERAGVLAGSEEVFAAAARRLVVGDLRRLVQYTVDALDGDGGAARDAVEWDKNRFHASLLAGRVVLDGSLDAESGELVMTALDAMRARLHPRDDRRPRSTRDAEALVEICRQSLTHDHTHMSRRRRGRPHLTAVVDLRSLEADHPDLVAGIRAEAEHVGRLSRATLERLACDCEIARVITDGPSEIIDVGRSTRNIPDKVWRALVVRDRHCTAPDCDRPPGLCEAHHIRYWEHGGPTDLANLRLLCWAHHRAIHAHDPPRRE